MRRLLEPIVLTILLAGQVALFTRLLHTAFYFDEGVYLLALDALRSGQDLGTQVFAAQPPVFYGLLQLIAFALDPKPETVRVGIVCLSAIGTLGAWVVVRSIAGSLAGLLAVALVIVSPPLPLYAARVLSDLPSLWLVLASVGVAAAGRHRLTLAASLTSGVLIGLATGTKLSAVIAAPLLVAVLARADRPLKAIAGALVGATVSAIAVVAWQIHALPQLMDSVVRYHDAARTTPDVIDRWASIADLFNARTPAFWLVTGGALVFVVRLMRRRCSMAEAAAWAWAGAALAFLAFHAPLHENHLVVLPIPLAVAAAVSIGAEVTRMRETWRPVVVLLLALAMAAGFAQQWRRSQIALEREQPVNVETARLLERRADADRFVVSDLPVAALLARRPVPGPLVDPAFLRFETKSLTARSALETIDRWCVEAVAAGRAFLRQPILLTGLRQRFRRRENVLGATVFSSRRLPCDPVESPSH